MSSRSRSKVNDTARRERRQFSAEFKKEAVRLMYERRAGGVSMSQVARELDLRPEQLREWAYKLGAPDGAGTVETPEQELRRLRRALSAKFR